MLCPATLFTCGSVASRRYSFFCGVSNAAAARCRYFPIFASIFRLLPVFACFCKKHNITLLTNPFPPHPARWATMIPPPIKNVIIFNIIFVIKKKQLSLRLVTLPNSLGRRASPVGAFFILNCYTSLFSLPLRPNIFLWKE